MNRRLIGIIAVEIAVLAVLVLLPSEAAFTRSTTEAPLIRVPDFTGLTGQELEARLLDMGHTVETISVASDQPDETVIGQNPAPGSIAPATTRILIHVSIQNREVPMLSGVSRDDALAILAEAGFTQENTKIVFVEDPSTSEPGTVIRTRPAAGANRPSTIEVTLAAPILLPDPTEMELTEFLSWLNGRRVPYEVSFRPDPGKTALEIAEVSPRPGTRITPDTSVEVVLAGPYVEESLVSRPPRDTAVILESRLEWGADGLYPIYEDQIVPIAGCWISDELTSRNDESVSGPGIECPWTWDFVDFASLALIAPGPEGPSHGDGFWRHDIQDGDPFTPRLVQAEVELSGAEWVNFGFLSGTIGSDTGLEWGGVIAWDLEPADLRLRVWVDVHPDGVRFIQPVVLMNPLSVR